MTRCAMATFDWERRAPSERSSTVQAWVAPERNEIVMAPVRRILASPKTVVDTLFPSPPSRDCESRASRG